MQLVKFALQSTLLISIILSGQLFAAVTATIDRTDISAGETFILEIISDESTNEQPDLSYIPSDFTIVSNSQYSHTQIINNQQSSVKGWKIKLKTLKTGKLTIPPITVGNNSTQAIQLTIKDSSNQLDLNGQKKTIYLEAEVDEKKPYVQQQIIYKVSLYRAVNTHYARLTDPTADNSIVEKLGDDVQFEKIINNRRYIVTQRKYAVFPQKSGQITISPVNFTADVNDSNRGGYGNFLSSTRPVSITTQPINIDVQPQPAQSKSPWMPAQNVILADKWTPDVNDLKVGEPVTWTILLNVQGLSESQLPEIKVPTIEGLQWYYDSPQKERQINDKGILGQRIEKIAVIPSKEGKITIPEITINWWDIKTQENKVAKLPAKTLTILPSKQPQQELQIPTLPQTTPVPAMTSVDTKTVRIWQTVSVVFLTLWLITLIAFFKQRSQKPISDYSTVPPQSDEIKQTYKLLITALKQQDSTKVEQLLLKWIRLSGFNQITSLGKLKNQIQDKKLQQKLDSLSANRYSAQQQDNQTSIEKSDLNVILEQLSVQPKQAGSSAIPPLYPR